jgi:flavodoxin
LVVYFSRTGRTRTLAEEIAGRCGADLERIEDVRSRAGIFGYLRSAREALKRTLIDIRPVTKDPGNYELVVLGTPVWASHVCSPMRAYLTRYRGRFRQVAFFATQGGSGAEKVFREMADLCALQPVASAVFTDREIEASGYTAKLDGLLRVLARREAARSGPKPASFTLSPAASRAAPQDRKGSVRTCP